MAQVVLEIEKIWKKQKTDKTLMKTLQRIVFTCSNSKPLLSTVKLLQEPRCVFLENQREEKSLEKDCDRVKTHQAAM
jgi:hypothetical protein